MAFSRRRRRGRKHSPYFPLRFLRVKPSPRTGQQSSRRCFEYPGLALFRINRHRITISHVDKASFDAELKGDLAGLRFFSFWLLQVWRRGACYVAGDIRQPPRTANPSEIRRSGLESLDLIFSPIGVR